VFRPRSKCIIAAGTVAIIIATVIITATVITVIDGLPRQRPALAPAVLLSRG